MKRHRVVVRITIFLTALAVGLVYVGSSEPAALALVLAASMATAWAPAALLAVLRRRGEPWFAWLRRILMAVVSTGIMYVYLAPSVPWFLALGIALPTGVASAAGVEEIVVRQRVRGRV